MDDYFDCEPHFFGDEDCPIDITPKKAIKNNSYEMAKDISIELIHFCKELCLKDKDKVILAPLVNQLVRCSSSVAANTAEATNVYLSPKFRASKLNIACSEVKETLYWLDLLYKTDYLPKEEYIHFKKEYIFILNILYKGLRSHNKD